MDERRVLGERVHRFAAPPWVVFKALTDERATWLHLQPGEVGPDILEAVDPGRVVWSTLWPASPEATVEFELTPDGPGTAMRFRWFTAAPLDERGIGITRQRLNRKFGGDLREWIDTGQGPGLDLG